MPQILACIEGEGEALVDGTWTRCAAGSAYVTPHGVPHAYRALAHQSWRVVWVTYLPPDGGHLPLPVKHPALLCGDFGALAATTSLLYSEMMGPVDVSAMHNLGALVDAYARRAIAPRGRLSEVWDAVRSDLAAAWTIDALSGLTNISGEHLRRISAEETGVSPMRYVTHLRMREAAALLSSGSYKLAQVAERVGYDNTFAFSTAFRRHFGMPPSAYRTGNLLPASTEQTDSPRS